MPDADCIRFTLATTMPELPEVETTLRGIQPYLLGKKLSGLVVRDRRLRWPIPKNLEDSLSCKVVTQLYRRGKYIIIKVSGGSSLIHLGMSGSMRVILNQEPPEKHDHFDLITEDGPIIRYRDPRRFGCLLWTTGNPHNHPRLEGLGLEPLTSDFNGEVLYNASRSRKQAVKNLIMDGRIVVGVGNIYASEALYKSGIHPARACNRISLQRYENLSQNIKMTLSEAIRQGGTTLQDFIQVDGRAGYFEQSLSVYGRAGEPCLHCGTAIKCQFIGQRSTFYCTKCQR